MTYKFVVIVRKPDNMNHTYESLLKSLVNFQAIKGRVVEYCFTGNRFTGSWCLAGVKEMT